MMDYSLYTIICWARVDASQIQNFVPHHVPGFLNVLHRLCKHKKILYSHKIVTAVLHGQRVEFLRISLN